MAAFEWIRFLAGALLLLSGLIIFAIEMVGVFRFKYVLNRMHAAAMGDTLGIGFSLVGLILMSGFNFTSLKLFFVIVFLWFSSPTSSHLIARLEVTTDEEREKHYREVNLKTLETELAEKRKMADKQAAQIESKDVQDTKRTVRRGEAGVQEKTAAVQKDGAQSGKDRETGKKTAAGRTHAAGKSMGNEEA